MKQNLNAIAMVTKNLLKPEPVLDFLNNSRKFGHRIDHLIISYEDEVDKDVIARLEKAYLSGNKSDSSFQVTLIQKGNAPLLNEYLINIGLHSGDIDAILGTPFREKFNMVTYGTSRNYVLVAALMLEVKNLFFFDSDIYPKILTSYENEKKYSFEPVDFIGSHLQYLSQEDVLATTSDYTGYYIIPTMNFTNLELLLWGVQKENRIDYIKDNEIPVFRDQSLQDVFDTHKVLGGNLAIDLSEIDALPPFFSVNLILDDECFLGRGEDTLFTLELPSQKRCVDIDLRIFHNCFGDFPNKPLITKKKNLDRFFYACMGWIIRNPFFNWINDASESDPDSELREYRYRALVKGSESAAEYFDDERFLKLPRAFQLSYEKLGKDIEKFRKLMIAWNNVKLKLPKGKRI